MGTRKLELKDIVGYLPYQLYCINPEFGNPDSPKEKTLEVIGMPDFRHIMLDLLDDEQYYDEITPILRPLSDLHNTIVHNSKKIIPIVELAKMFYKEQIYYKDFHFENGFGAINRSEDGFISFNIDEKKRNFNAYSHSEGDFWFDTYDYDILNIELLDYLNELKIDYRGLIDSGLAISVYDLENNPYK